MEEISASHLSLNFRSGGAVAWKAPSSSSEHPGEVYSYGCRTAAVVFTDHRVELPSGEDACVLDLDVAPRPAVTMSPCGLSEWSWAAWREGSDPGTQAW